MLRPRSPRHRRQLNADFPAKFLRRFCAVSPAGWKAWMLSSVSLRSPPIDEKGLVKGRFPPHALLLRCGGPSIVTRWPHHCRRLRGVCRVSTTSEEKRASSGRKVAVCSGASAAWSPAGISGPTFHRPLSAGSKAVPRSASTTHRFDHLRHGICVAKMLGTQRRGPPTTKRATSTSPLRWNYAVLTFNKTCKGG